MFEPASPAYYAALFSTPILVLVFATAAVLLGIQAWQRRSWLRGIIAAALGAGMVLSILANPVTYLFTVPLADARVASMHDQVTQSGLIGTEVEAFTQRFGDPEKTVKLRAPLDRVLVYSCIPWFAYGWDELHVYAENGRITGARIDD